MSGKGGIIWNFRIPTFLQMDVVKDQIFYFRKCGSQTHAVPRKGWICVSWILAIAVVASDRRARIVFCGCMWLVISIVPKVNLICNRNPKTELLNAVSRSSRHKPFDRYLRSSNCVFPNPAHCFSTTAGIVILSYMRYRIQ